MDINDFFALSYLNFMGWICLLFAGIRKFLDKESFIVIEVHYANGIPIGRFEYLAFFSRGIEDSFPRFVFQQFKCNILSVFIFDVENEIHCLPGVAEAVVVGIPDSKYGEVPAAMIQLEPGAAMTGVQVRDALLSRLARYKIPEQYLFVSAIPRTAKGKTDKKAVRARFAHPCGREI